MKQLIILLLKNEEHETFIQFKSMNIFQ